ncbi:MAG: phosphate ABC transporter permease subunit PstC [Actinobacteria bacterium]|nr:phosphate ABC transporter permease subunit PstC [Actinomycetota bacterium]
MSSDTNRWEIGSLRLAPARRRADTRMRLIFSAAAVATLAISILIIYTLVKDAWGFFIDVPKGDLWNIGWFPRRGIFDIKTLILGTLMVTGIAMLIAVPLGLGVAIYLSEFAAPRVRRVLKPIIEVLAGIPSVVLGYFAISFINPNIITALVGGSNKAFNVAAAGVAVGILTIPIIASVSEDALRAVPMALREASYGLGARRVSTTFRVVFPAAISGIVAALILGISRAIGETMVVAIAAGAVGGGLFSTDPFQPGQTMTAAMAALGFGSDQVAGSGLAFQSLFFIGFLLFVITLVLNMIGDRLVRKVREEY